MLAVTLLALAWSALQTEYVAVPVVIAILVLLQLVALLHFVEAHVDTLEEFFAAINYEDFTRRFVEDDVDIELKEAFNRVLEQFQDARAARDVQAGYLETVVRHVPVPFIAEGPDGVLSLVNNPARRLTGIPALRKLEQLAELDPAMPGLMQAIEPGQQQMLQTKIREIPVELRVSVSEIRLASGVERLYSIENLSGELTARESSAWRNLIRVLTHEIMNTLTPVTSLAQTTGNMLDDPAAADDVRDAVATIARRSEGLMTFVSRYRELLKVPVPDPQNISVTATFQSVTALLKDELGAVKVDIAVSPDSLEVHADAQLLDQVLLNLVRNALDAMHAEDATDSDKSPTLRLQALLDYGRIIIRVADNGPGIADDAIDQIFVPFFTTKREGSGIGLSLSRQIMTAHGGEIVVDSNNEGTTVSLVF
ncbi:MAG: two-component system nitrogen regulation sensor histidine kinase NtrY [Woeseiaceae bacterium]|jgi:two-component system nitrogen regulation sensor histidine kinase NtrY